VGRETHAALGAEVQHEGGACTDLGSVQWQSVGSVTATWLLIESYSDALGHCSVDLCFVTRSSRHPNLSAIKIIMLGIYINPFTDEQLNLLGTLPKQVCYFSSLYKFCLGCKTISR